MCLSVLLCVHVYPLSTFTQLAASQYLLVDIIFEAGKFLHSFLYNYTLSSYHIIDDIITDNYVYNLRIAKTVEHYAMTKSKAYEL